MTITKTAAAKLDKQVRTVVDNVEVMLMELRNLFDEIDETEAYKPLGFKSIGAYIADVFKGKVHFKVKRRSN